MSHGCCADKACTHETCMQLPTGKTCGDCVHLKHCSAFYAHTPVDSYCDFFPRRFVQAPPPPPPPRVQVAPFDV